MRYILSIFLFAFAASAPSFAAVDDGLLALVPPGSRIIACVDISQAKNSQFGQYMLNKVNTQDQSFEDLTQATGFDPRRDLKAFVVASQGSTSRGAPGGNGASQFALIARGGFDRGRIRASAQAKGATIKSYHGVDLFIGGQNDQANAFAFMGGGIAVMGDVNTVQQIIANRGTPAALDGTLQRLIANVGPNNDAWFVSVLPGSYLASHIPQQANQPAAGEALQSILQSSGGIQFGDVVRLSFDAIARSAKDAQSLADVIRFVGSMAQMSRDEGPAGDILASAVDQMTLQTDGDALHASISLPEKSLEQLADIAPMAAHHRNGVPQH